MHRERPGTARRLEDLHRVPRIRVHGTHDEAGHVRADGDEAQVEGPAQAADVGEGRAVREVRVFSDQSSWPSEERGTAR